MRKQFKKTIMELAEHDDKTIMVLGDVSVYLFNEFKEKYPDRFYNMGICENTLISAGAGLSSQGFFPFVHTIAPFLTERSYEQIKLDMCYNKFGGNIVTCGASFDYAWDGPTHHSYTDLAILRLLPEMEVIQPGSEKEADILVKSQYNNGQTTYFRLSDNPHTIDLPVRFGEGVVVKEGSSGVTVATAGPVLSNVLDACSMLDVNILYFHTIKPIDKRLIEQFRDTKILVVHDAFGLYEAIQEIQGLTAYHHHMPDMFCSWYGTVRDIREKIGLGRDSISARVRDLQKL